METTPTSPYTYNNTQVFDSGQSTAFVHGLQMTAGATGTQNHKVCESWLRTGTRTCEGDFELEEWNANGDVGKEEWNAVEKKHHKDLSSNMMSSTLYKRTDKFQPSPLPTGR